MAETEYKLIRIGLVGKYTRLADAYVSVCCALQHASIGCRRKLEIVYINAEELVTENDDESRKNAWEKLNSVEGIVVPGGFGLRGLEGKITALKWARENKKPCLGVCLGYQCAVIEFARNVMGWSGAYTTEILQVCFV